MAQPSAKILYIHAAAVLAVLKAASHNQHTMMLLLQLRWGILCRRELLPKHISLHPNMGQVMHLAKLLIAKMTHSISADSRVLLSMAI